MLSEKSIKLIEDAVGVHGLLELINSKDEVDINPKKTKHFTQESYDVMVDNLSNNIPQERYNEIKSSGEEMAVKNLKKELGYEFEGRTIKALNEYLTKQIQVSKEGDIAKVKNEYEITVAELKKTIEKERSEKNDLIKNFESETINHEINRLFDSLEIDIPDYLKDDKEIERFKKVEREKNRNYFLSLYEFKRDDNKKVIPLKGGQVIKDDLQNPLAVDKLFESFVSENFIATKKQTGGRGEGDRNPLSKKTSFKDMDDFNGYLKKNNIAQNSSKADALYNEWQKNK